MGGAIVTSVNFLSVPGNRSSPCPMSMATSIRFLLAELTAYIEISESTLAFPVFLKVTLLPSFNFISLILSITIFDHTVSFRVLDRYTTLSLSSCGVAIVENLLHFRQWPSRLVTCSISIHTRLACRGFVDSIAC